MAYKLKEVFYLDTYISSGTSADTQVASLDVSAYIAPIARGKTKATGLAIYKVHWDIVDGGSNDPIPPTLTGTARFGLAAGTGIPAGTASLAINSMNAGNSLYISIMDYWTGGTASDAQGSLGVNTSPHTWLKPSKDVPYVVVRDSLQIISNASVAFSSAVRAYVRLECAQITLDQTTLNQLLRTQTV